MTDVERVQEMIQSLSELLKKLPEDELFDLLRDVTMEAEDVNGDEHSD